MICWKSAALLLLSLLSINCEDGDSSRCPQLSLTYSMMLRPETSTCYQFHYGKKTWKDARNYCHQYGGHLVTIDDPVTFTFLRNTLNSMSWRETEFWIGLNDMDHELSWKWVQDVGEPSISMTWSNWHEDHPQGWFHGYRDCIKMKKDDGDWTWHEVTCNTYPWVYRFICQYEATGAPDNNQNIAGVHSNVHTTASTSRPRTTLDDISTLLTGSKEGNYGNGNIIGGEHRKVTGSDANVAGINVGLSREGHPKHAAVGDDEDDNDVPLYAVIISFGAGILVACAIILFVIIKRRRRKKQQADAYPTVVYQAQSAVEAGVGAGAAGAVGPPSICSMSGKPCKIAVTSGSQKCTCDEEHERFVSGEERSRRPCGSNVYVRVDDVDYRRGMTRDPVSNISEPGPSGASSMRDMSLSDEQPPTYDEACVGIAAADAQVGRPENIYTEEPQLATDAQAETQHENDSHQRSEPEEGDQPENSGGQGAIPKQVPDAAYLPMNGSPKPQTHNRTNSSNTYVPMSLGELPPIPTDEGYEIPVSSRLDPEAIKSMRLPEGEGENAGNRVSAIYSEIPDRNSRLFRHMDEEIYQTID